MSKYKLGSLDTKDMLKFWKDFTVESKDIKSEDKGIDLYRVELTNGEVLLCRACFEDDCPGEYRLEVISPESFSYDVTKEEIKKISKYTNCKVIGISNSLKETINGKEKN